MRNNWLLANDKTWFIKNTCLFTYVQCRYWLFKVQSQQHSSLLTFSSDAILLVCRSLPMLYSSDYSRSLLTTSLSGYVVYMKRTSSWCDVYYSAGLHSCRLWWFVVMHPEPELQRGRGPVSPRSERYYLCPQRLGPCFGAHLASPSVVQAIHLS